MGTVGGTMAVWGNGVGTVQVLRGACGTLRTFECPIGHKGKIRFGSKVVCQSFFTSNVIITT